MCRKCVIEETAKKSREWTKNFMKWWKNQQAFACLSTKQKPPNTHLVNRIYAKGNEDKNKKIQIQKFLQRWNLFLKCLLASNQQSNIVHCPIINIIIITFIIKNRMSSYYANGSQFGHWILLGIFFLLLHCIQIDHWNILCILIC